MLLLTRLFGPWAVTGKQFLVQKYVSVFSNFSREMYLDFCHVFFAAFTRGKNIEIVPAANTYIQVLVLLTILCFKFF